MLFSSTSHNDFLSFDDTLDAFVSLFHNELRDINAIIIQSIQSDVPLITLVAQHLIMAGGKRLRPLLAVACSQLFQTKTPQKILELATSIEFIHTATLLHDDVIDESSLRRGQQSVNALYGNKTSILVGDYLFAKSFQLMIGEGMERVLPILANASQIIAKGEILQLSYLETFDVSKETLLDIMGCKTAALFKAACEMTGAYHEQSSSVQKALGDFGFNLGMVFQIMDDYLDYFGNTDNLGKNRGDDLQEKKVTLPLLYLYYAANSEEKKELSHLLEKENVTKDDMHRVEELLEKYTIKKQIFDSAHAYFTLSKDALITLPPSHSRDMLERVLEASLSRIS